MVLIFLQKQFPPGFSWDLLDMRVIFSRIFDLILKTWRERHTLSSRASALAWVSLSHWSIWILLGTNSRNISPNRKCVENSSDPRNAMIMLTSFVTFSPSIKCSCCSSGRALVNYLVSDICSLTKGGETWRYPILSHYHQYQYIPALCPLYPPIILQWA